MVDPEKSRDIPNESTVSKAAEALAEIGIPPTLSDTQPAETDDSPSQPVVSSGEQPSGDLQQSSSTQVSEIAEANEGVSTNSLAVSDSASVHTTASGRSSVLPARFKKLPSDTKKKGKRRSTTVNYHKSSRSGRRASKNTLQVDDEYPDRIVTPLLEMGSFRPQNPARAADLIPLHDVWFPRPDTYPLSYFAGLLGFEVPPLDVDRKEPVALPDPLVLTRDTSVTTVPPLGTLAQKWKSSLDQSDKDILQKGDPLYKELVEANPFPECLAVTAPQRSKLMNTLTDSLIQPIISKYEKEWKWRARPGAGVTGPEKPVDSTLAGLEILGKDGDSLGSISYHFRWFPLESNDHELILVIDELIAYDFSWSTAGKGLADSMTENSKGLTTALISCALAHARVSHVWYASVVAPSTLRQYLSMHFGMVPGKGGVLISSGGIGKEAANPDGVGKEEAANLGGVDKEVVKSGGVDKEALNPGGVNKKAVNPNGVDKKAVNPGAPEKDLNDTKAGALELEKEKIAAEGAPMRQPETQASSEQENVDRVRFICDLNNCSSDLALFVHQGKTVSMDREIEQESYRVLACLPSVESATSPAPVGTKSAQAKQSGQLVCGAPPSVRGASIKLQAMLDNGKVSIKSLSSSERREPSVDNNACIEVIRTFKRPFDQERGGSGEDEVASLLGRKQLELHRLETSKEPSVLSLMREVIQERELFEGEAASARREMHKNILLANKKMLARRKELDQAVAEQREQDMDAVCDICDDGEVTPDNQILFCECCNVAVHQFCYGVEQIPPGDYYCSACRYRGLDNKLESTIKLKESLPEIFCELCCMTGGAYIRTAMKKEDGSEFQYGKWVHMVCAKWQGLNFVDGSDDLVVEDVTEFKAYFRRQERKCGLCLGERGALNECRYPGCKVWLHVTCARAIGTCEVIHGEDVEGPVETNPWTLMCPTHSKIPADQKATKVMSVSSLIKMAKLFPPEPKPTAFPFVPIPFNTANGKQRKVLLADNDYEKELLVELTTKRFFGARCEVCDQSEDHGITFTRCGTCAVIFCDFCKFEVDKCVGSYKCARCVYLEDAKRDKETVDTPSCQACYQPNGWLRRASARSMKKSYKKRNPLPNKHSLFSQSLWCHSICAYWNEPLLSQDRKKGTVNFSNVVETNGKEFIKSNTHCFLCGQSGGLKLTCNGTGCLADPLKRKSHVYFHVTCARQSGLEVDVEETRGQMAFYVRCYRHGGNEFNLRAKLEDLVEKEKLRAGKALQKIDQPMNFAHASRLLNAAIRVLRTLGWAWRWSEWWVDFDSSWEPLLEPGEKEENMTAEELKIVVSDRKSRCADARRCRLAAFGAALRNREYDLENGFDRVGLDRALRAVLNTPSLVGPLSPTEIEFFAQWLGLAYRSKSPILGFGEHKIPISADANEDVCRFTDGSLKYELGTRSRPGTIELGANQVFEHDTQEPDNYMLVDKLEIRERSQILLKTASPASTKKRRGRPPKSPEQRVSSHQEVRKKRERDSRAIDVGEPSPKRRGRPRMSEEPVVKRSPPKKPPCPKKVAKKKQKPSPSYNHEGIDKLPTDLTVAEFVAQQRRRTSFEKEAWDDSESDDDIVLTKGRSDGKLAASGDGQFLNGAKRVLNDDNDEDMNDA